MAAEISGAVTPAVPTSDAVRLPNVGLLSTGPQEATDSLIFLHGWGGGKELWQPTLAALPAHLRALALDLPGTGATPLQSEKLTMPEMAAWVGAVCRQLGIASATLIGHSLGGNLAAQVALDFPALARRLVLVDAALEPGHLPMRSRWPLSPTYGLLALRLMRWSSLPFASLQKTTSPARRAALYVQSNTDAALRAQLRALHNNSFDPARLALLHLPLLIIHGAHDHMIPLARARALAQLLPQARLEVFPHAFHCPMDTDLPAFIQILIDFCRV